MAKVTSALMGTTRGSVGNVTLRRSNGQTVASQKVTDVKNPRSFAQAEQRMRMAAATTFYSPLSDVLAKAWQGKTRTESMGEFTRSAIATMRAGGYGFVKTWPTLRPYPFQVSRGSLPSMYRNISDRAWLDYTGAEVEEFETSLSPHSVDSSMLTSGMFYDKVIDYLGVALSNLQVTFVVLVVDTDASGVVVFTPKYGRVMLSKGSDAPVSLPSFVSFNQASAGDGFSFYPEIGGSAGCAAMSVIISGHNGKKWLRSTEYMAVAPYWIDLYQSSYQVGVESFMDAAARGTAYGDVYLDGQGAREDAVVDFDWSRYQWVHPTSESGGETVISSPVVAIDETLLDGVPVPGVRFANGEVYHIMGSDRMPTYNKTVNINTNTLMAVTGAGIPEGAYIKTTDTALQQAGYNEISRVCGINSALWYQS